MKFGSLDGCQDDEDNGVGFVEISKLSAMQDEIIFGWKHLMEYNT